MGTVRKILPNYTYEDYLRWEGRWEIIDGLAYDMSPMASPNHQKIAGRLHMLIQIELDNLKCDCHAYQPIDLKINENTVVNPDLSVICEDVEKQFYDKPPRLVVEIISPSSKLKDTITKYDLYRDFGIKYYLLIDPEKKSTTLYILSDKAYELSEPPYVFEMREGCSIGLDLARLWG